MTPLEPPPRPAEGGTRPAAVATLLADLAATLDDGAARGPLLPLAPGADPAPVLARLRTPPAPGTAVVLATSGSTNGTGHLVALTGAALRASAEATHARLGGPGQWLACLPTHHVAGLQVLVRSVVAGTSPVVLDTTDGFRPADVPKAVGRLRGDLPSYLSLVPTQLRRVLEAGGAPLAALARLDAVLLGGARTPAALLDAAARAGVRVVTTYGMTETGGGCVYDGVPLAGVRVRTDAGRVLLAGPVLADGYLDDPQASAAAFVTEGGERWLRTADRGALCDGRLAVQGRLDDVLITGGVNVSAGAVERVLADTFGEVVVVGVADDEWGVVVTAVVAGGPARLADLRARVVPRLGGPAAPRALVVLDALPLIGPGKVDRRAVARLATEALAGAPPAARVRAVERH
ncbi:AMP-binding protein [Georgenia faecalis]|uniref:AMP-binding protein n=1 Tax=Georgenia faecalis TaxID=2483799 RepID=UPI000FDCDA2D|nr:AMP-binding protein [Georgenia faecalis]